MTLIKPVMASVSTHTDYLKDSVLHLLGSLQHGWQGGGKVAGAGVTCVCVCVCV